MISKTIECFGVPKSVHRSPLEEHCNYYSRYRDDEATRKNTNCKNKKNFKKLMVGLEFDPRLSLSRKSKNPYVKEIKLSHKELSPRTSTNYNNYLNVLGKNTEILISF